MELLLVKENRWCYAPILAISKVSDPNCVKNSVGALIIPFNEDISIANSLLGLIQIIVPIVLLCMCTYQLIRLMQNPEMKNGIKSVTNKFLAAAIVFFVPFKEFM